MSLARLFIILLLIITSFAITNLPNFHLDNYLGLRASPMRDMAFHGSYYFVMTFPIFLILHKIRIPVLFVYSLFLIPALFEFSQAFIPGRSVSAHDLLGNYLGIVAGLSICFLSRFFIRKFKRKFKMRPAGQG